QVVSTPGTAKDLWDHLEKLFHDNKDARAINLDNELHSLKIGNMSINNYCTKCKSMADGLKNLGSSVSEKNLVIYAVNGLDSRFATIVEIIRHREPLPSFKTARNMLLLKESTLNNVAKHATNFDSSTPSPIILMATKSEQNEVDIKSRWYSECEGTNQSGFLYSDELKILSRLHHENILSFIGYCDEKDVFFQDGVDGDKVILVYELGNYYGSLAKYLREDNKPFYIPWADRLKICIGIAKGLKYLHSGVEEVGKVIHNDIQSKNIMLASYLEPKIMGFYHSVILPENQPHVHVNFAVHPENNPDPIYHEIGLLDTTTDVYSYGIRMFEMLIGMVANEEKVIGDYKPQRLINIVRRCYDNRPEQLIDPFLRDHIDRRSFQMFIDIAYRCISFNLKDRPTMDEVAKTLMEALDIHVSAKFADPEVDSLVRSAATVMTEATTVATVATTVAIPADFSKDKSSDVIECHVEQPCGRGFRCRQGSEKFYVPEWTVTNGVLSFERWALCANMIDHFTPPCLLQD
ncbi:protein kinase, ATP binding site-containing protein, partial [Tanacetum coccineum]